MCDVVVQVMGNPRVDGCAKHEDMVHSDVVWSLHRQWSRECVRTDVCTYPITMERNRAGFVLRRVAVR